MTRLVGKRGIAPLVALVLGLLAAPSAHAQTVITGRVTNEQGAPIVGANVAIPTLGVRTEADASGNYRLTIPESRVTSTPAVVVGRFIGFQQGQRTVTLTSGSQTVNEIVPETQCVSYNYLDTRLDQAESVTAVFTVKGASVKLSGNTVSINGSALEVQ